MSLKSFLQNALWLLFVALVLLTPPVVFVRSCLSARRSKLGDAQVFKHTPAPSQSPYDNLSLGIPGEADCIVDREGYALGYSEEHEQAIWVTYKLTREELAHKVTSRTEDFRVDPAIPTGSAELGDYRYSGFDRGHLAPAADMAYSYKAMSESFFMSNMSPQNPDFNSGIWNRLEQWVRGRAKQEGELVVVTGPILPEQKAHTIGWNKVTVPDAYYKVVYDLTHPQKMVGFIVPNRGSSQGIGYYAVTVDEVESATGLDFFSGVPQPEQERMESTFSKKKWGLR